MKKCDVGTNETNQKIAWDDGHTDTFARVMVRIVKVNGYDVDFIPKGQKEVVSTKWRGQNAWPDCPTEVVDVDDEGIAMIGGKAYREMSRAAQDLAGRPKWPEAEGLDSRKRSEVDIREREQNFARPDAQALWGYTKGKITITSLRVEGVLSGETTATVYELISPELRPDFTLDLSGFSSLVTIVVDGQVKEVKMQVLHAVVRGHGEIETINEADMMDPNFGYAYQAIRVEGATATVTLSQKGCALFGVPFKQ
jgi:hypothetical protein